MRTSRIVLVTGALAATLAMVAACAPPASQTNADNGGGEEVAPADVPDTPSEPVSIHVVDVAGNLKMTQPMIEQFAEENPDVISDVSFESAGAPDLVGMVKPQVESGDLRIDLVLSGTDGMSAGIGEDLWIPVAEDFADRLPNMDGYVEGAAQMQELAEGYGVLNAYTPSGPLLWYNPDEVSDGDVPSTPDELLAWVQENPNKFGYPRPANSGVGRTFLQGLPYLLGDEDPTDPENGWDKTWDYLKELDQSIDYYTTGTGQMVQNVADGTWTMTPTTMGWDIEPRADERAPKEIEAAAFDDFTFVADSQYALLPRGLSADKQSALLLLLNDMLEPDVNAIAYDNGYFYPGPAVEGATLDKAPQESQDAMAEYGRDFYDGLIEDTEQTVPLSADALVTAFDMWDREIGSNKVEGE